MMKFIIKKPITPSQRNLIQLNKKHLIKKPMLKKKLRGLINSSGRNNFGRITVSHKGGGHKKKYRRIDFNRSFESKGIINSIEYDPNRNANVASVYDVTAKDYFYMIAPKGLDIGNIVKAGTRNDVDLRVGNSVQILKLPSGSQMHNISPRISKPSQISRSAGTFSKLIDNKSDNLAKIELSSGEYKAISLKCYVTIGVVSNEYVYLAKLGKAGQSRWLNKRPTVRGVAMNPIDHPHGGGEGKKSGRRETPWGKPTKKGIARILKDRLILKKKYESS